jgi:hypothetical protein
MIHHTPIGERPRGSRIDDLGPTHISVPPETGRFEDDHGSGPPPCGVTGRCDRTLSRLGPAPHWPVLTRPRLAGFQVSTEGVSFREKRQLRVN